MTVTLSHVRIPLPPELDHHFELASLAVLDAALLAAEHALVAAHPHMRACEPAAQIGSPPDSYWIATVLLSLADQLRIALDAYRQAAEQERQRIADDQDFPF